MTTQLEAARDEVLITRVPNGGGYNVLLGLGKPYELYVCVNANLATAQHRARLLAHALICTADPHCLMSEVNALLDGIRVIE